MKITFLGAVEEVTGSRYLIEQGATKILVDCGMFQGPREITQRNTAPFPVDPKSINAVILTHAHIDHSGYLPALVKNGFTGKIYCSPGTYALCSLLLVDSGSLQEGHARNSNARGGPDHPPAVALYTVHDAKNALKLFQPVAYDTVIKLGALQCTFMRSGHILGSSFVVITDGKKKLTFSGDLARPQDLILKPPPHLTQTDFLVLESTYGDRLHEPGDPLKALADVVNEAVKRGGMLVIPCFAVERAQTILYCLYELKQKKAIPAIPIFLDSPMAIRVNALLGEFKDEYKVPDLYSDIAAAATTTPTVEESKQLDRMQPPAIIVAGSGMADGGRVMFHLQRFISDAQTTVLFVGYQSPGTAGNALVSGAREIKLNGKLFPVHAQIRTMNMLSAHADYDEILQWLSYFETKPQKVFLTHGDKAAAESLAKKIEERFGWSVVVPKYLESFNLD